MSLPFLTASAAEPRAIELAVLYPDVPEPYSRIFSDIVAGIEEGFPGKVRGFSLSRSASLSDLESWLERKQIQHLVALGNQAMGLAVQLPDNYTSVTGAVLAAPEQVDTSFSAITLAPDPDLMFEQLKLLAPDITTVSVIYEQVLHGRLIRRAQQVAAGHGIKLELHIANGVKGAANLYREFFLLPDANKRAIWLLQGDKALQDRSVLYSLLKDAWYNKVLVFSSNPSYVKKGVLFSLYPDNIQLGIRLAQAMEDQIAGDITGVIQTRQLLSVLNIRTAEHLGLPVSRSRRREFDVIFPSQ